MKRLTLVRHAKSSWKHPDLADFDRPLNKRGDHDAPIMGQRLVQRQIAPELLISSPAKRAITTAHIIAQEIGYPVEKIVLDQNIYEAGVSDLLNVLQAVDNAFDSVMLFGHNPGLTSLSTYLTDYQIDNIPTCGVFCADFDLASWADLEQSTGTMVFFDFPKNAED